MEQGRTELVEAVLMPDTLPEEQAQRLAELEQIIKTDLAAFLRVGAALAEIRDRELYLGDTLTFDEYLKGKWGMGRSQGYRLIDAHEVVENLRMSPIGDILPVNEAQIRPLTKYKDNPELAAQAWRMAVAAAPEGKVTARLVKAAVAAVSGDKVARKVREIKAKAATTPLVSKEFQAAYELFMEAIVREAENGYAQTEKETIIEFLEAALEVVVEG